LFALCPGPACDNLKNWYEIHRHQANYHRDAVVVDYVDYDEVDYDRFRRVEKQLAS
jgi:hypothetical protein